MRTSTMLPLLLKSLALLWARTAAASSSQTSGFRALAELALEDMRDRGHPCGLVILAEGVEAGAAEVWGNQSHEGV